MAWEYLIKKPVFRYPACRYGRVQKFWPEVKPCHDVGSCRVPTIVRYRMDRRQSVIRPSSGQDFTAKVFGQPPIYYPWCQRWYHPEPPHLDPIEPLHQRPDTHTPSSIFLSLIQTLDNRRANSLLGLDFIIIVKAWTDHLNIRGSNNNITVSNGSNVDIEFKTWREKSSTPLYWIWLRFPSSCI